MFVSGPLSPSSTLSTPRRRKGFEVSFSLCLWVCRSRCNADMPPLIPPRCSTKDNMIPKPAMLAFLHRSRRRYGTRRGSFFLHYTKHSQVARPWNGGSLSGNWHRRPKRGLRSLPSLASEHRRNKIDPKSQSDPWRYEFPVTSVFW
jgi:hypothetical protein